MILDSSVETKVFTSAIHISIHFDFGFWLGPGRLLLLKDTLNLSNRFKTVTLLKSLPIQYPGMNGLQKKVSGGSCLTC